VSVAQGGRLEGYGTVDGDLANAGILAPALSTHWQASERLVVTGNYRTSAEARTQSSKLSSGWRASASSAVVRPRHGPGATAATPASLRRAGRVRECDAERRRARRARRVLRRAAVCPAAARGASTRPRCVSLGRRPGAAGFYLAASGQVTSVLDPSAGLRRAPPPGRTSTTRQQSAVAAAPAASAGCGCKPTRPDLLRVGRVCRKTSSTFRL
jgi:hypothetical protein